MLGNNDLSFDLRRPALALGLVLAIGGVVTAQAQQGPSDTQQNPATAAGAGAAPVTAARPGGSKAPAAQAGGDLLKVPIATIVPGGVPVNPEINKPPEDPAAAQRGMKAFNAFNCVGCHMGNGGGGMGPRLSQRPFIYGSEPANIYLTIVQGRPRGMPAWGSVLPESVVWDLVAYIRNLSNAPSPQWGESLSTQALNIEQVPAEKAQSDTPWQHTEPFTSGQRP